MESLTYVELLRYLRGEQKMQLKVFRHVMSEGKPSFFDGSHQAKYNTLEKLILLVEVLDVDGFQKVLKMARERVKMFKAMEAANLFPNG